MKVNDRIKKVRQTLGFTQAKFAERIAISTSYLAGMELGTKKVNERTLRLLSMEFGVDEHWLRTGAGSAFSRECDARVIKATSLLKSLEPQLQKCALVQLNALAELQKKRQ